MLYGLDVGIERQLIVVGDSKGRVYFVDARSEEKIFQGQLHKKGMKVATTWAAACMQTTLELEYCHTDIFCRKTPNDWSEGHHQYDWANLGALLRWVHP